MNPQQFETWVPLIAISLVGVSLVLHFFKKTPNPMTLNESLANVGVFVVWRFIFFARGVAIQLAIFKYLAQWVPWGWSASSMTFIFSILIADFLYYWKHRCEHRLNILWAQHAVHHSSEEFNLSTSLRLPWLGSYMGWIFFLPAIAIGFSPMQILMGYQIVLAYQYLVHTEFIGHLGIFEKILNTPSNHRVHHGRNEPYLDKNYGGIFIIWDRLFKTYEPEVKTVDYGTVTRVVSKNPLWINWQPWWSLWVASRPLPWFRKIQLCFVAPAETQKFIDRYGMSTAF
ncbi:sterol desaturase family protein [bacterium]|nr:sterol desaturase family protein [bacterium]